jgi:alpha-amylase/alpha-mannosidase (GH57 family)
MSPAPLKVAFIWHMHQPYYKNPRTGVYRLPWVRLHAVKDYYDMAARLAGFPRLKATFNFVPCLVEQLLDYAGDNVREVHLELSKKPADRLTRDEKVTIIRQFFLGNRRAIVEPYSRYRSLLEKCQDLDHDYKVDAAVRRFKTQDFLDLQVWSNLAWMGSALRGDPEVAPLFSKGRQFTQEMKMSILGKQIDAIGSITGMYRDLVEAGRVELTTSPYFHPMLPLVSHAAVAATSTAGLELPAKPVCFPEDAEAQVRMGLEKHEHVFGRGVLGMWPPEGGVCDETLDLLSRSGVRWTATDEKILERTLGVELRERPTGDVTRPDLLYRPFIYRGSGGEVVIFFRDKLLSDLIGFEYAKMPPREAVQDFVSRLLRIKNSLGQEVENSVVVVALDGENHWEHYDRGGDEFLRELYGELSKTRDIVTVCPSELLADESAKPVIREVFPGSWIQGDFTTWIGHGEANRAWDLLASAREALVEGVGRLSEADSLAAWRSIYAAEGSDWFWWYGGEHTCKEETEFDALFRAHIRHVYELLPAHVPHEVLRPVMSDRGGVAIRFEPVAVLHPDLDGRVTTFYEWKLAGLYESYRDSSRAVFGHRILESVYFGFDHEKLYLRLDTSISPQSQEFAALAFRIEYEDPAHRLITLRAASPRSPGEIDLDIAIEPEAEDEVEAVALETTEIAIGFGLLGAKPGDVVSFRIAVLNGDDVVEHRPVHEVIRFSLPTPEFDAEMWSTL